MRTWRVFAEPVTNVSMIFLCMLHCIFSAYFIYMYVHMHYYFKEFQINSTKYYELEYNYSVVHVVILKIKRNVGVIFGSIFKIQSHLI